jgi:hypothetical protein
VSGNRPGPLRGPADEYEDLEAWTFCVLRSAFHFWWLGSTPLFIRGFCSESECNGSRARTGRRESEFFHPICTFRPVTGFDGEAAAKHLPILARTALRVTLQPARPSVKVFRV